MNITKMKSITWLLRLHVLACLLWCVKPQSITTGDYMTMDCAAKGWTLGSTTYFIPNSTLSTWAGSTTVCQRLHPAADLAVLTDLNDFLMVAKLLSNLTFPNQAKTGFWIGLNHSSQFQGIGYEPEWAWQWLDQTMFNPFTFEFDFSQNRTTNSSMQCAFIDAQSRILNSMCTVNRYPLCGLSSKSNCLPN
jgi:hypothetical protein